MNSLIKNLVGIAIITVGMIFAVRPAFADGIIKGGDAFDLSSQGQPLQMWDTIEYGKPFHPTDLPEYELIQKQIAILKPKAPKTAAFLEYLFKDAAMWFFVKPKLKNTPATGESSLDPSILTFEKIQAAATNPERKLIQINEGVWNKLDPAARAFLLLHEALWLATKADVAYLHAYPKAKLCRTVKTLHPTSNSPETDCARYTHYVGRSVVDDLINLDDTDVKSSDIRALTGILMNPDLDRYSVSSLARLVQSNSGKVNEHSWGQFCDDPIFCTPKQTPLAALLAADATPPSPGPATPQPPTYVPVPTFSVLDENYHNDWDAVIPEIKGLRFTPKNDILIPAQTAVIFFMPSGIKTSPFRDALPFPLAPTCRILLRSTTNQPFTWTSKNPIVLESKPQHLLYYFDGGFALRIDCIPSPLTYGEWQFMSRYFSIEYLSKSESTSTSTPKIEIRKPTISGD